MAGHHAEHAQQDATLRTMALGTLILNTFSVRAAPPQAASYGAAAVPSKTMCRQTLTSPDGTERHRRFYLAVLSDHVRRSRPTPRESSPKCDQTKRTGAADLCQKIPDEPAIGKNLFKHRALAPAGSLARRAALRTALQARPFPRTGASLLTGLGPHSLRSEPRP